jgi:hypothetical protein
LDDIKPRYFFSLFFELPDWKPGKLEISSIPRLCGWDDIREMQISTAPFFVGCDGPEHLNAIFPIGIEIDYALFSAKGTFHGKFRLAFQFTEQAVASLTLPAYEFESSFHRNHSIKPQKLR